MISHYVLGKTMFEVDYNVDAAINRRRKLSVKKNLHLNLYIAHLISTCLICFIFMRKRSNFVMQRWK